MRTVSSIEQFGDFLLTTGDLDPLYIALVGAELPPNQLSRWLFAYWCCYNAGASSYLSEREGDDYWRDFYGMAANDVESPLGGRWPRGHERRHFRGEKACEAARYYANRWPIPESVVSYFSAVTPRSFQTLRERVTELPQFGPWIAFKVADMLERVVRIPIDFSGSNADQVMLYKQPYEAALTVWELYQAEGSPIGRETVLTDAKKVSLVVDHLVRHFNARNFMAPPKRDRRINVQEVETILCKWKSNQNGHYPLGLDSNELRHGLSEWSRVSPTAGKLLASAPLVEQE